MKIKDYKCECGCNDFFFADKGNQKGIYCSYCGKWLKWADKNEQNLAMKQESVLDKIKADIEEYKSRQLSLAIGVGDLEYGKQLALDHVLSILDEYKIESEVKNANSD